MLVALACCATEDPPATSLPDPFERVWTETIRPGDLIVAVPGTGTFTGLGQVIEAKLDPQHPEVPPEVDGRTLITAVDPLEGAIAAATRAGLTDADLEAGTVTLGLWGAGITKLTSFRYRSVGGLRVTFEVIGGTSVCAIGGIPENLTNYNGTNAELDARDLYRRMQAWLARDGAVDRNVILVSHSWGGVVAEFLAANLAKFETAHGPLPGASVAFVIAAGVPGFVPGYAPLGPGFRTVDAVSGDVATSTRTYEVDRPDDPAHSFDPAGNGDGHHYIIMFGDQYQGWYGITTDELSCGTTPGECPKR